MKSIVCLSFLVSFVQCVCPLWSGVSSRHPQVRAVYHFDLQEGATTYESVGAGSSNLSLILGPTTTSDAISGKALQLDGDNDELISITDSSAHDILAGSSLEFWIKYMSFNNTSQADIMGTGTNAGEWLLYYPNETLGVVRFYNDPTAHILTLKITSFTWTHLAIVNDGSSVRIYKNGAMTDRLIINGLSSTAAKFRMGSVGSNKTEYLADEMYFWRIALTAQEVKQLYESYFSTTDNVIFH